MDDAADTQGGFEDAGRGLASGDRVLITGATGLVGSEVVARLRERGHPVRILSRSSRSRDDGVEVAEWDGIDPGPDALEGVAAIVHLSGEPVFGGLPSKAHQERVRHSRVASTAALIDRIEAMAPDARPRIFVCASAVGYYGDRGEQILDEQAPPGEGFLADVCRDWEAEAARAAKLGLREVRVRIAVVLSKEGGALALMQKPFRLGVGGRLGSGKQYFPWIHRDDLAGVLVWALEGDVSGAVNGVAPETVRNRELTRQLGDVLNRPTILPVPGFAMKAALGAFAGELLGSRRVVSTKLAAAEFEFAYPTLRAALDAELG